MIVLKDRGDTEGFARALIAGENAGYFALGAAQMRQLLDEALRGLGNGHP